MVEHARRVIERAGDEEHEKDHELGHGDLDRTGLSEGALLPRGLPAWSIVDRRTVLDPYPRSGSLQPTLPVLDPTASAGGSPAVAMTKRSSKAAAQGFRSINCPRRLCFSRTRGSRSTP